MQKNAMAKEIFRNGFVLAVLLHLLMFLCLIVVLRWQNAAEKHKKPPQLYIPSYVYRGAITPSMLQPQRSVQPIAQRSSAVMPLSHEAPKSNYANKKISSPKMKMAAALSSQQSVMNMSQQFFQQDSMRQNIQQQREQEPILLVGDPNESPDPLIRLIGKSLSANFNYPRMEGTFGIRGRVLVHMVIHPEGYFSDIQIVQSSDNNNFDAAALYAVNKAPRVVGANQFISKPKPLLIGFIFD